MDPTVPAYFYAISFVSQAALLLTLGAGLWIAFQRTALSNQERSETWITITGALLIWFAVALWLGRAGVFVARTAVVPPIPFAILLPIAVGLYLLASSRRFAAVFEVIPQSWLTGVQIYRVLGAMFLALWTQNRMPGEFALPAGTGDVIVGLAAPIVAWLNAAHSPSARNATIAWNIFGVADLVIAVGSGFLTSPSPYQMLAFDRPNELIVEYPFVLVPAFFVPLSIILHVLSLWKLRRADRDLPVFA
jgi:hypothetical protein